MNGLQTHLGFSPLGHERDCAKPEWEVEYLRRDSDRRRHDNDTRDGYRECGHQDTVLETVARIVCRSCFIGHVLTGENVAVETMSVAEMGLDPAPRRVGGYWLHAGRPSRTWRGEPEWLLVTTTKDGPLAEPDIVGEIAPAASGHDAPHWSAVAGLECNPRHSWRHDAEQPFKSQAAAVRWIAAQLDPVPVANT